MANKNSNDNRSRQLNPKDAVFWQSRGEPGMPTGGTSESDASTQPPATPPTPTTPATRSTK